MQMKLIICFSQRREITKNELRPEEWIASECERGLECKGIPIHKKKNFPQQTSETFCANSSDQVVKDRMLVPFHFLVLYALWFLPMQL